MSKIYRVLRSILVGAVKQFFLYLSAIGIAGFCITAFFMFVEAATVDMQWLTSKLSNYWSGDLEFDEADIWRWFLYSAIVFGIISKLLSAFFSNLLPKRWYDTWKIMLWILGVSLFLIYVLIPFQPLSDNTGIFEMYVVVTALAFISTVSILLYGAVNYWLDASLVQSINKSDSEVSDTLTK